MAEYDNTPIVKKVPEKIYVGFDISEDLDDSETISSCTAEASDDGLTVATASYSGKIIKALVSAGTAGVAYAVRFTVITSASQTLVYDFGLKVKA